MSRKVQVEFLLAGSVLYSGIGMVNPELMDNVIKKPARPLRTRGANQADPLSAQNKRITKIVIPKKLIPGEDDDDDDEDYKTKKKPNKKNSTGKTGGSKKPSNASKKETKQIPIRLLEEKKKGDDGLAKSKLSSGRGNDNSSKRYLDTKADSFEEELSEKSRKKDSDYNSKRKANNKFNFKPQSMDINENEEDMDEFFEDDDEDELNDKIKGKFDNNSDDELGLGKDDFGDNYDFDEEDNFGEFGDENLGDNGYFEDSFGDEENEDNPNEYKDQKNFIRLKNLEDNINLTESARSDDFEAGKKMTERQRRKNENLLSFPLLELPDKNPRKKKPNLITEEQQIKKMQNEQRRKVQAQKFMEEQKRQTVERILNEAGRKQKQRKEKEEQKIREKTNHKYRKLPEGDVTIKYLSNKTGQNIFIDKRLDCSSYLQFLNSNIHNIIKPERAREKCSRFDCNNEFKYRSPKTGLLACSFECFKGLKEESILKGRIDALN